MKSLTIYLSRCNKTSALDNEANSSTKSNRNRRETLPPLLLGLAIGTAVCGPFFRGGWLLLLDWGIGPHAPLFGPTFFGLHGGINGNSFGMIVTALVHLLGSIMSWLPLFFFFPLACLSIARLVRGGLAANLSAGLFFSINPFVVDRIYAGQFAVIYAYLLLPILFKSVHTWINGEKPMASRVALLLTLMISIDINYAWIGGLVVATGAIAGFHRSKFRQSVLRLFLIMIPLNIYLVIPILGHKLAVNPSENSALLNAFRTTSDPHLGLFVNVLGLYGFWRHLHESSKSFMSGWPLLLLAILIICAYGTRQLWKRDRRLTLLIGVSFILAYFLALGTQGPTGSIFHWAYRSIPAFSMMREPEKFSAILATGISLLIGEGIGKLSSIQSSQKASISVFALGFLLGIAYNPIAFWGLHGQIQTSQIPSDWATVARITNKASGKTLLLPWHLYLSFPFTNKRIISNPGPSFLPGDIISGDNIEIANVYTTATSQRSAYIDWLVGHLQQTNNLGGMLAPLGVQYVVIFKTFSTGNITWISKQRDMKLIYQSKNIDVIKNEVFVGAVQKVTSPITTKFDHLLRENQASNSTTNSTSSSRNQGNKSVVLRRSPTSITFRTQSKGWVNIATEYEPGWRLSNQKPVQSSFGTLQFYSNGNQETINYAPWNWILIGYSTSALCVLALVLLVNISPSKTH